MEVVSLVVSLIMKRAVKQLDCPDQLTEKYVITRISISHFHIFFHVNVRSVLRL